MKKLQTVMACLALAGAALAQSNTSAPKLEKRPAADAANEASNVAPDAAVITIDGLCEKPANSSATPADCKTVITRAEFDKVANTFQPNMPAATRKQLANRYVLWLYLAEKAHEFGLDQGPAFDEKMHVERVRILAQLGGEQLDQQLSKVTDGEIENYYHDHADDYKTISFDRLRIPKQKQVDPAAAKAEGGAVADLQKKRAADAAEMKAEADKLRARAAAGEDFAKLQQEAFDFGGFTQMKSGNVRVENVRKTGVLPSAAAIFELKPGEVSQVFDDPSEFVVYKIVAADSLPLASVHDEISRILAANREKDAIESVQKSTTLNDAYFAIPTQSAPPTLRNPGETAPAATPPPGKN